MLSSAPADFQQIVYRAGARAEVRTAVTDVYDALSKEIDVRRPRCDRSGRCCHFDDFGHRLYVTTMELATFIYDLETRTSESLVSRQACSPCPFQENSLCTVHPIRPFGCRLFFCDPTATDWQTAQYERFHAILKARHAELDVPYHYLEWRSALSAVGLLPLSQPAQTL